MEIQRQMVADVLRSCGEAERAERVERELPETIDIDRDGDRLTRLGVDPKQFLGELGGGLPNI